MNITALPELLLSWLRNPGGTAQAGKESGLGQLKPGSQYDGQVLEALPNGRNVVQVANQAMDMALPQQARPGDVVRLTFLSLSPRPTFVLDAAPAPATAPVSVSQAAQQVNALVRYVPIDAATPVPGNTIAGATATTQALAQAMPNASPDPARTGNASAAGAAAVPTGRPLVANPAILLAPAPANVPASAVLPGPAIPAMTLAGEAVDGARAALGSQTALATAQGVVADQASPARLLPMRLQQTVKESGLFYESHLGKWVRGELGLETIQREPQARLSQAPGPRLDLPDLEGMPEQAARLASRQLHLLEGGPFVWQGQVWPGQVAEWQVGERDQEGAEDAAAGQKWHSRLRLTLPRLGTVAADLDVGALGLRVRLRPGQPDTLAEIKAALPELVQRLRDAELNLSSVQAELADADQ
ncbi:flagellar hook-length control protein FliK [Parasulfuritortus cantonensis]|uniref:Flagellar hook-length control protein FliK n=1 Tax=Parasulfuritortus cantonensis TaxID=2528202 RepID=A0A4R1BKU4_9PROT|nr:flagellar hook-length control protein FliK [Parasulfuritortus cantonensis]TCJ17959.1 flagellar hook-length control protein FliK [Parasulfuritortus cantonensis]